MSRYTMNIVIETHEPSNVVTMVGLAEIFNSPGLRKILCELLLDIMLSEFSIDRSGHIRERYIQSVKSFRVA